MNFDLFNIIWIVLGGVISFFFFVIKNSYNAGKVSKELITKDEVEIKITALKVEFDRKMDDVDTKIELKFQAIESTLKNISDSLIKQETREIERFRYEQETKENGKQSLDRICTMIVELNKKQEDISKIVASHEGIINNRRQNNVSFEG